MGPGVGAPPGLRWIGRVGFTSCAKQSKCSRVPIVVRPSKLNPRTGSTSRVLLSESIERWLDLQGFGHDDPVEQEHADAPGATLLAAAVAGRVAHGKRAGAKVRRLRQAHTRPFRLPPMCGESGGYNLHAGVVIAARDREGLQRLCRYVLRPPLARTRMSRRPDGLWVLTLRRPYSDGTTAFMFSELVTACFTDLATLAAALG